MEDRIIKDETIIYHIYPEILETSSDSLYDVLTQLTVTYTHYIQKLTRDHIWYYEPIKLSVFIDTKGKKMYLCIHTYMYICMCLCLYTYMYVCNYCTCVYLCMYVHVYVCIYIHMCIYNNKYNYVCMYLCMYVFMYVHVCMCVYVCMYECMYFMYV